MRPVDADELLKKIDEEREYLIARGQAGAEHIFVHNFRELVENAPTVEQEVYMNGKDYNLYLEGYKQGKKDFERPQGEWIKIFENPFTNGYICPFCGHKIQVTEQFLPKVTECEGCGAEMRGDKEE